MPSCLCCDSNDTYPLLRVEEVPGLCNILLETREEALAVPRGTLDLQACTRCGHVFNKEFMASIVQYDGTYENSLHFSPRFQDYATELARDLTDTFGLKGGRVIDVGCGQGEFLDLLCAESGARGTGYDPSYDASQSTVDGGRVEIVATEFPPESPPPAADLVTSRHVLEHISRPVEFVRSIARSVARGDRRPGLFLEVPSGRFMFEDLAVWDLIYEHCSYFSPASLSTVAHRGGFSVHRVFETYGGQYLCLEGSLREDYPERPGDPPFRVSEEYSTTLKRYPDRYREKVERIGTKVTENLSAGRRPVLWGAGSKAVMMSNVLGLASEVPHVVDINPRKHGRFISGTGQKIVAPHELSSIDPDVVVALNPAYQDEIEGMIEDLGVDAEVVVAM